VRHQKRFAGPEGVRGFALGRNARLRLRSNAGLRPGPQDIFSKKKGRRSFLLAENILAEGIFRLCRAGYPSK